MSQGGKDVTVHHSHSAFTVRLVPGCLGVYPWSQLPCAPATQNLAGGFRCFQRGFHRRKKFFVVFPPPKSSYTLSFPPSLSSSLSLLWPFCWFGSSSSRGTVRYRDANSCFGT